MDLVAGLAAAVAALAGLCLLLALWVRGLRRRLAKARREARSQSTRYGQITEQFAPFLAAWPWDPKGFRFIGGPIDGIQFTPEGVVLVEIKAAGSQLSPEQKAIRAHVEAGRVTWREVRIA